MLSNEIKTCRINRNQHPISLNEPPALRKHLTTHTVNNNIKHPILTLKIPIFNNLISPQPTQKLPIPHIRTTSRNDMHTSTSSKLYQINPHPTGSPGNQHTLRRRIPFLPSSKVGTETPACRKSAS